MVLGSGIGKVGGVAIALVVVAVVGLAAFMLGREGALKSGAPTSGTIEAGSFAFTYPRAWAEMPSAELKAAKGTTMDGEVIAGLCPGEASDSACSAGLDVNYVLFKEGKGFPGLATLENRFAKSFPHRFEGFRVTKSERRATSDGTSYLWYEFSFQRKGVEYHQVVAAYSAPDDHDLVVIASGPKSTLTTHRTELRRLLDGATVVAEH